MKNLFSLFLILAAVILFSCTKSSDGEEFLRGLMKNRMNNLSYEAYTESKNGDTIKFEVVDKGFSMKGIFRRIADYEVVTINEDINKTNTYCTAVFSQENGVWQSVFDNELEPGILDTIIDLNSDGKNEIIIQFYERRATSFDSRLVIYAKKEAQKYKSIGTIAPNRNNGNAYNKVSSTVELLQLNDCTMFYVNTLELDAKENNKENQKLTTSFYLVTKSGELTQDLTPERVLSKEPLLFKVSQDNLWGIYSSVNDIAINKAINLIDGPMPKTKLTKTKEVLPIEYSEILLPSEGLIPIKNRDSAWGIINYKGEFIVNCKYKGISKFENGKAVVQILGEEDWRKTYQNIDANGKELGLFFDKIEGSDCVEARLTVSSESGEKFSEHSLRNCPNGVMSVHYKCWEWSSGEAYYPGAKLEDVITLSAEKYPDFSGMLKKFDGNSVEYIPLDECTFSVKVTKASDGSVKDVFFTLGECGTFGSIRFEVKDYGVMVSTTVGK